MQDAYGEKCITGFHRYGRFHGAVVPLEALMILAGDDTTVDEEMKLRIMNSARNLLQAKGELR